MDVWPSGLHRKWILHSYGQVRDSLPSGLVGYISFFSHVLILGANGSTMSFHTGRGGDGFALGGWLECYFYIYTLMRLASLKDLCGTECLVYSGIIWGGFYIFGSS